MNNKLNELRLDAGIARIENQQWLCVLDKETGMMIDPMIGLETFAQLIVTECIEQVITGPNGPAHYAVEAALQLKKHFGVEEVLPK